MTQGLFLVLALLGAYLLGSVPTAYVAVRIVKGIDLRRYGSGNVGASNAAVHMGKAALFGVGLVDVMKGVLPVAALRWLGMGVEAQLLVGLAAVIGHNWSLYLGFTGGRGVATAGGVLLGLGAPASVVGFFFIFILLGLLFRDSGLWLGIGAALVPLASLVLGQPPHVVLEGTGLLALLMVKRLMGNWEPLSPGLSCRKVLLNRLVYDRDISDRRQWVTRQPMAKGPKG
ncbi:MAG: acyl-phosphate glycerol 3-phosphate acyltransferase [Dehalococcoidia bacterium]|nr:acyl-phosphate glycerol 3-phosphate acyltransferase [Dehalococcoidia bacterium]